MKIKHFTFIKYQDVNNLSNFTDMLRNSEKKKLKVKGPV